MCAHVFADVPALWPVCPAYVALRYTPCAMLTQDGLIIEHTSGELISRKLRMIFAFTYLFDWLWVHQSLPERLCANVKQQFEVLNRPEVHRP